MIVIFHSGEDEEIVSFQWCSKCAISLVHGPTGVGQLHFERNDAVNVGKGTSTLDVKIYVVGFQIDRFQIDRSQDDLSPLNQI